MSLDSKGARQELKAAAEAELVVDPVKIIYRSLCSR